jgi:hypothetical protein
MSTIAAATQTADRIDYWIRRHVRHCYGIHPSEGKLNTVRGRQTGLFAIGQSFKEQYDALATPMPPHLSALVTELETQK